MANLEKQIEDREYLHHLRDAAENKATEVASRVWVRAYQRLADAANCLDAMEARSIDMDD